MTAFKSANMNRLFFQGQPRAARDELVTTSSWKSPTSLKKNDFGNRNDGEWKKRNVSVMSTHSKFDAVPIVFLIAMLGIIFVAKSFTPNYPCVAMLKTIVKQNKTFRDLENIKLNIESLTRVINAISLQNGIQKKSITLENVLKEVLDVQELYLFDEIDIKSVNNVIKAMHAIDSLANQSMDKVNEITKTLNKLDFSIGFSSKIPKSQDLFFFNASHFDFGEILTCVAHMSLNLNQLVKELKKPTADFEQTRSSRKNLYRNLADHETHMYNKNIVNHAKLLVNSLLNAKPFISNIEQYQLLTNQTYLRMLIKGLESLQSSTTILEACQLDKSTRKQFDVLNRLLNKKVIISNKHALIGFPRGSKDIGHLLKDLDNEWLRKLLNNGSSLHDLKNILNPIFNFKITVEEMENLWTKRAQNRFSKLVRKSFIQLENICATNTTLISSSLANVITALKTLKPVAHLNNSILNELKQFLNSSTYFTSFSNELDISNKIHESINNKTLLIAVEILDYTDHPEKFFAIARDGYLKNTHEAEIHLLSAKTRLLENIRKNITRVLSQTSGFRNTLTDAVFTHIREILPQEIVLKLKVISNHVKRFNSLLPFSKIESEDVDLLPNILLAAKNKIHKWRIAGNKLRNEIEETNGFRRLLNFPFAHETAFQLACFQRALMFFERRNLCDTAQSFVANGRALSEKITSLSILEKTLINISWKRFQSIIQSINTLLSETQFLTFTFPSEDQGLTFLGNSLFVLDHINVSTFNFSLMVRTLAKLKETSIGQSEEVSNFEKVLEQLNCLQCATMRRNSSLSKLLAQADIFFQSFFSKQAKTDWNPLLPITIVFFFVLNLVLSLFCLWIRTIQDGRAYKPNKTDNFESGQ